MRTNSATATAFPRRLRVISAVVLLLKLGVLGALAIVEFVERD